MTDHVSTPEGAFTFCCRVDAQSIDDGILLIQVVPARDDLADTSPADRICEVLASAASDETLKVIVLAGLGGGVAVELNAALATALADFPLPVIAQLPGDCLATDLLIASLCDVLVCAQSGRYGWLLGATRPSAPTSAQYRFAQARFGEPLAASLFTCGQGLSGAELAQRPGWGPVVPADQVASRVRALAMQLAEKPRESLCLLKQHLARNVRSQALALTSSDDEVAPTVHAVAPRRAGRTIALRDHEGAVLVVTIKRSRKTSSASALARDLEALLQQQALSSGYRAVVLASQHPGFVPEQDTDTLSDDASALLQQVLARSPLPVVAVAGAQLSSEAWLALMACDAVVYQEDGLYRSPGPVETDRTAASSARLFGRHLGAETARELLLAAQCLSGAALRERVPGLISVAANQMLDAAVKRAEGWRHWPRAAVMAWKRSVAPMHGLESDFPAVAESGESSGDGMKPGAEAEQAMPIPLATQVVSASALPGGIVHVQMHDRDARNMFSQALIEGLAEIFDHVRQQPTYKVVVLTGYDTYFASGGTKQALLAIQAGEIKFTDDQTFRLPLDCPVPVIAAMQGHAIGAGLSLGLFCDFPLLSEESQYVSPYMGYGFTPGVGATLIVPERFGAELAFETLMTAAEFEGAELKARGVPVAVYRRADLPERAMALAQLLASQPRAHLVRMKRHLNRSLAEQLTPACELEVSMHAATFVGHTETLARIEASFAAPDPAPDAPDAPVPTPSPIAPPAVSLASVRETLKRLLARDLHLEDDEVDFDTQYTDLGLDSITGVTWIRKVNASYDLSLDATIVYTYPTLAALARHIKSLVETRDPRHGTPDLAELETRKLRAFNETAPIAESGGRIALANLDSPSPPVAVKLPAPASSTRSTSASTSPMPTRRPLTTWRRTSSMPNAGMTAAGVVPASAPVARSVDIAVIGMAGEFPKARDIDAFWDNLQAGRDCVEEVSTARWRIDDYYQAGEPVEGKTNSRWLGQLEDYDRFDPLFFNISPAEARAMDPQQRRFLQTCWHSIEHAGFDPRSLAGSRCGVFVGAAGNDYGLLSRKMQHSAYGFTGNASSILAARIAYVLDLQGPCVTLDTACSASLVAIATACDSLSGGTSDIALAGGVYIGAGPSLHIMTAQSGMLSADGRCHTFDHRANGFVPGEAVGVVVLKRLADAERDGDIIHAVVRGWGVNQDGRTNGITAPNPSSQARLIADVYARYDIDPAQIQLIEAHGTGTALGDPIEVRGLVDGFGCKPLPARSCALGSVKSNIGHCLAAAGVVAFIKGVLALAHRQLPPTVNFERLNPHINLENSPFYINTELKPWSSGGSVRRHAAVSSFGYSGTNAHIVLAEYNQPVRVPRTSESTDLFIVPLSAKAPAQLVERVHDLLAFVQRHGESTELADLAYTLQVGRSAMDERLGFVVQSMAQLAQRLQHWLDGHRNLPDTSAGQVQKNREALSLIEDDDELKEALVDKWISQKKYSQLLRLWAKGVPLDWQRLYGAVRPRRIVVPTYPFARERYWVEADDEPPVFAPPLAATEEGGPASQLFFEECWVDAGAKESAVLTGPSILVGATDLVTDWSPTERIETSGELVAAVDRAAAASGQPATVVVVGGRGLGRMIDGIAAMFDLFGKIRACGTRVGHVLLVGCADPASLESVWESSWIGFQRSLRLVMPGLKLSLLFTDSNCLLQGQIAQTLADGGIVRFRADRSQHLSIVPVSVSRNDAPIPLRQHGQYLITGGAGGLGSRFARYLAQTCQARLILVGRRQRDAAIEELLRSLREAGAVEADYFAVDLANEAKVVDFAGTVPRTLAGVIHAAGVVHAGVFHERTREDIAAVLAPKTTGTVALDDALREHALDFVSYFSSSAAVLGDMGACDYAIANRFLMAYAEYRERVGLPGRTVVINWPYWEGSGAGQVGMGPADTAHVDHYLKSSGQKALPVDEGLAIWRALLQEDRRQTLVMAGQPSRVRSMLERLYQPSPVPADGEAGAVKAVPAVDVVTWPEHLRSVLRELVAQTLQLPLDRLDDETHLADYGLDSIGLTALAKTLGSALSLDVTPALFFNHGSVQQLFEHFSSEHSEHFERQYRTKGAALLPAPVPAQPSATADRRTASATTASLAGGDAPRSIAIIGMSGRFPKATDVESLWHLLADGRSGVDAIPASRPGWWSYRSATALDERYIRPGRGGFIDAMEGFDPLFFDISPAEAEEMDPCERLLMMEAYRAIEDAGVAPGSLRGQSVGMFVGMEESPYSLVTEAPGVTTQGAAMVSSRLAYFLDLRGPVVATNTACSSGLVALHQAVTCLRNGECESALVAAVSLSLSPKPWLKMSEAGMLSPDGQCRSFSRHADGIGIGEAVVALMLAPLDTARSQGLPIYAVIRGSGTNFDGKTNGVTAPNGLAQEQLIESVYTRHGIDVREVSHVIAHGTGTRLGDPVELNALHNAFRNLERRQSGSRGVPCAVTSCKSNVGHTLAASGLVSLVALVQGMVHGKIPATLNCEDDNDYIAWGDTRLYINKATRDWQLPEGYPRLGAVSAFGRSGTNAHVVLEGVQVPSQVVAAREDKPCIVPLSARTPEQLREQAQRLLAHLGRSGEVSLAALAHTLQLGRDPLAERLAIVTDNTRQLQVELERWLDGQPSSCVVSGSVSRTRAAALASTESMPANCHDAHAVAREWVRGEAIDWPASPFARGANLIRLRLPTYPFAKDRYWLDEPKIEAPPSPVISRSAVRIEDILDQVDAGALVGAEAVAAVKTLVGATR